MRLDEIPGNTNISPPGILSMSSDTEKDKLLEDVLKSRGFVESFHRMLAEYRPELLVKWTSVWKEVFQEQTLDKKTASLIRLAVVASQRNKTAVAHSLDQAIDAGASMNEIIDSLSIAFVFTGVLTLVDSLSVVEEMERGKKRSEQL